MAPPSDSTWDASLEDPEHPLAPTGQSPADAPSAVHYGRYRDDGPLATGGMCEVRRVWDTVFGFRAAIKLLRAELLDMPAAHARFAAEALITARIQHPGVVAVYERGQTPAGRPWFTMSEVRGATFGSLIDAAHAGSSCDPADLRRLVGLLLRATDAVAYAHSQGILHRDLKPANLMVGAFGEVLVMDWGLARALDLPDDTAAVGSGEVLLPDAGHTRLGEVLGTPNYMPPEQARGAIDQLSPSADVFALGAVLYELLTGHRLDTGGAKAVWRRRMAGAPPVFTGEPLPHDVPGELADICRRALADQPADRFADASGLADALRQWLAGAQRRARALEILDHAADLRPAIDALRAQAADKRARAAAIMAPLLPHSSVEEKAPAWDLEDEAEEAEREAVVREVRWRQAVGTALEQVPDLPEAHAVLADHYAERLLASEQEGRRADVARFETLLADHDQGRHAALLSGVGAVTLVTDPPGAEVRLYEYVEQRRRLVPVFRRVLGRTPLVQLPLDRGSWLLELNLDDHHVVNYPIHLERGEAWEGVRPGEREPYPIVLPRLGELGQDECYVPAGWFIAGGDPLAIDSLPRQRVWVDGFCVRRFPVTLGEFSLYLEAVMQDAGRDAALAEIPVVGASGHTLFSLDGAGPKLQPSHPCEGLDHPVVGLSWQSVQRFLVWAGRGRRQPWRLPWELEWEKAARGVDGRLCAWGNTIEPTRACIMGCSPTAPERAPVSSFPEDVSPYGVRGTVGNVRDWCGNEWTKPPPAGDTWVLQVKPTGRDAYVTCHGGAWSAVPTLARAATRFAARTWETSPSVGFRLTRSLPTPG